MKKRFLSLLITLVMVFSILPVSSQAVTADSAAEGDVIPQDDQYIERTEWYDDAVTYCSENGLLTELLQQDDDNLDDGVTWVTLAQALSELAVNYSDEIYTSEVNWAKDFGLIKENVSENDIVSRFDAAKTFSTFISKSNVETNQPLSTSNFVDFLNIPASYQQDVLFVESTSLMNGYGNGTFGGNDPLTRCQLAQILYNGKDFFSNLSMSKIFSLSENDITCIDIQSGSTGDKKSITDADEILGIVNLLNNFEFNSIRIVEGDGWARRLILHFSSGEMFYFYISPSSITINNIIYESDIQYFPPTLL